MRELVDYVAQVLVQHPDQLELREDDEGLLLVVADEDLGSVVGPGGKTARALRSVLAAARGPDLDEVQTEELPHVIIQGGPSEPPLAPQHGPRGIAAFEEKKDELQGTGLPEDSQDPLLRGAKLLAKLGLVPLPGIVAEIPSLAEGRERSVSLEEREMVLKAPYIHVEAALQITQVEPRVLGEEFEDPPTTLEV